MLKFRSTLTPAHLRFSLNITSLFITYIDTHGRKRKTIFGLVSAEISTNAFILFALSACLNVTVSRISERNITKFDTGDQH